MRALVLCLSMALLGGGALPEQGAPAPRLQMTLRDGRVTIVARDVPLTDILAEWSRLGQTRIVNAEKMAGPRLTIQLLDVSERDALDILLRSAAGYIAAPRPADRPGPSAYDRVTILAASRAPAATAPAAASMPPESGRTIPANSPYATAPYATTPNVNARAANPTYVNPSQPAAAPDPEPQAEPDSTPVFQSMEGAQPVPPPPARPSVAPHPGMVGQLETSQPRGVKLSDLLRNAGEPAGPQTATKPGPVPGPGGRGGGQ